MSIDKFTRRRFFEKSLYLFSLPLTFYNLKSFATGGEDQKVSSPLLNKASGDLPDHERIAELLKKKDPLIWLFTGDSITHGAKHTHKRKGS